MRRSGPHTLRGAALAALALALAAAGCGSRAGNGDDAVADHAIVRLSPSPAFAGARLAVTLGDEPPAPGAFRYEWRRNGSPLAGESGADLDPARFRRGDRIAVRVTDASGAPVGEAGVDVVNSPPFVASATVAPDTAAATPTLQAIVVAGDADGDGLRLEYAWTRNGEPVAGATTETLPAAAFERGDRIAVTVVARDGDGASPPVASEPFALENRAPVFTSQPPAPRPKDPAYAYRATASDPDGDALRFELVRGPEGMTLSPDGELAWPLPTGVARLGDHAVVLRAVDPSGAAALQQFTIALEPLAAR